MPPEGSILFHHLARAAQPLAWRTRHDLPYTAQPPHGTIRRFLRAAAPPGALPQLLIQPKRSKIGV